MNKIFTLKSVVLFFLIIISAITLYSRFPKPREFGAVSPLIDEKFDEELLVINSCERLDSMVSKNFRQNNCDTARTVPFIDDFLRNRFYHSYSELTLQDNWIAALCGKIIWRDFLYPVRPCDIIKYPMGACSQQGIVFQHQLDVLKIPCSTIQFFPLSKKGPGHYAVSVYYNNSWHFYDSNQEPLLVDSTMPSIATIINKKLYEKMYIKKSNKRFQDFFKNKSYKRISKEPFSKGNMYYFQTITAFLSSWLWLFFLVLYLFLLFKPKK
jgi:hypothetical protein